ncbi:hypothetical protein ME9_01620, partial [Bartonella taylorii 8TBB]
MKKLYTTPKALVVSDFKNSCSLYRLFFMKALSLASVIIFLSNVFPVAAATQIFNNISNDFSGGTNVLKGLPLSYVVGSKLYRDIGINSTFMGSEDSFKNLKSNIKFDTKVALDTAFAGREGFKNAADAFSGVNFTSVNRQLVEIKENPAIGEKQKNPSQGDDQYESADNFPFMRGISRGDETGSSGTTITIGANTAHVKVSFMNNKGEAKTLLGVAAGDISKDSTEAVNGSQFYKLTKGLKINDINKSFFDAKANGEDAIALGNGADASGPGAFATGPGAKALSKDTVAIGNIARASAIDTIAIGVAAKSTKDDAIAIGASATGDGSNAIAIGITAKATREDTIALGHGASSGEYRGIAIGSFANASVGNSIALGSLSIADVRGGVGGYDPVTKETSNKQDSAWVSTKNYGALSIGNAEKGITRQIMNVAAGSKDTDAVNVAQLKALQNTINPNWELSVNGENKTNVNSTNPMDLAAGSANLTLTKGGGDNKVKFDLAKDIVIDKVQTGDNILDATGLVIANGPKITTSGIDAGGKKIRAIANGDISASSTDAVAGNQLYTLGNSVAKSFGGNTKYENGKWTAPTFRVKIFKEDGGVTDTTYNNVASAFEGVGDSFEKVKDKFKSIKNEITKEIENNITISQGDGLLWDQNQGAFVATHGENKDSSKITSLKSGEITAISTDAINGSQLYAMSDTVTGYFSSKAGYDDDGNWRAPTFTVKVFEKNGKEAEKDYDNVADAFSGVNTSFTNLNKKIESVTGDSFVKQNAAGLITIGGSKGGTKIDISNNINAPRILSGVKGGEFAKNSTEAVNGAQLYRITEIFGDYFGGGAGFDERGKWSGPTFTVKAFDEYGNEIENTYTDVASALAGVGSSITNIKNEISKEITGEKSDSLQWSKTENAFVATHGDNKEISKITSLKNGDITASSTDAVAGNQLHTLGSSVAKYFGGGAKYEKGTWTAPTFKVKSVKEDGKTEDNDYHDVATAFAGVGTSFANVNTSITNIKNEISKEIADTKIDSLQWSK